jgi:RimJ/RimL family protein N-acetyltransferase
VAEAVPVVVELRSGDRVWVRPIGPGDAVELRRAFELLSEQSRYRRFFTVRSTLSNAMVRTFTEVDHVDHEALVALPAPDAGTILGVARFVRDREAGTTADLAITVADGWHGRGMATALLRLLSRQASQVGIVHFTADMLAENRAVLALVRAAGGVQAATSGSTVTAHIEVNDQPQIAPCDVVPVLRPAARGQVLSVPRPLREVVPDVRSLARALLLPTTTALASPDAEPTLTAPLPSVAAGRPEPS